MYRTTLDRTFDKFKLYVGKFIIGIRVGITLSRLYRIDNSIVAHVEQRVVSAPQPIELGVGIHVDKRDSSPFTPVSKEIGIMGDMSGFHPHGDSHAGHSHNDEMDVSVAVITDPVTVDRYIAYDFRALVMRSIQASHQHLLRPSFIKIKRQKIDKPFAQSIERLR